MNHAPTKLNIESKLFCPRRSCFYHQSLDNNITKDGVYKTKNDGVVRKCLAAEMESTAFLKRVTVIYLVSMVALKNMNKCVS